MQTKRKLKTELKETKADNRRLRVDKAAAERGLAELTASVRSQEQMMRLMAALSGHRFHLVPLTMDVWTDMVDVTLSPEFGGSGFREYLPGMVTAKVNFELHFDPTIAQKVWAVLREGIQE